MKKLPLIALLFYSGLSMAQIKFGDNIESISPFSLIEIESKTQGLLISRMTSSERDEAFDQSTPLGMMIFNLDENILQCFIEEVDPATKRKTGSKVWERATGDPLVTGDTPPEEASSGDLFYNEDSGHSLFLQRIAMDSSYLTQDHITRFLL